MHWRNIKWRALWQKRHLSVLENFLAEDNAERKAAERALHDAEIAHRTTLTGLEGQRRQWDQLNDLLRRILGQKKRNQAREDLTDEFVMVNGDGVGETNLEDADNADERWQGNYEAFLQEYENT